MRAGLREPLDAVAAALRSRRLTIGVGESCTGGLLAAALTELPGSSDFFLGGAVTYSNAAKSALLKVPPALIRRHGAVSARVAEAMATGAGRLFGADVGVGITGVAGPDSSEEKPVGLTYIATAAGRQTAVREFRWRGGRSANRRASVDAALALILEILR